MKRHKTEEQVTYVINHVNNRVVNKYHSHLLIRTVRIKILSNHST